MSEKNQFIKKDFPSLVAAQTNLMSWENITMFKGDDFMIFIKKVSMKVHPITSLLNNHHWSVCRSQEFI